MYIQKVKLQNFRSFGDEGICFLFNKGMQLIFSLILIKIKRPITHLDHLRPIIKNQCCSCMTKTQQKI